MNPLHWLEFFRKLRKYPFEGGAVLALFLLITVGGVAVATGRLAVPSRTEQPVVNTTEVSETIIGSLGPSPTLPSLEATPTEPVGVSEASEPCSIVSPINGRKVGGTFSIEGRCKALAGATVFVVVRDLYRNLSEVDGIQQHWIQCGVKIKDTGEFICGAFLCVNDADYEILVVWPPPGTFGAYEEWLNETSQTGRSELPHLDDIRLVGSNHTVTSDHGLSATPAACGAQKPETD